MKLGENMKKIELLAPAGNKESFDCALNGGADAIYLGLGDFNARGNIENFNFDNIRECVKKAHLFGVKVYVTLNILFVDGEIESVLNLVRRAIDTRVDAFIVQDIGVATLLKNKFPKIELHASTQMGVSNLEGAKFLRDFGFKRIVLARETPLSEIKRIHDSLDVELEYFVQGALCVSYSGNCYLCSLYGGASGNRGKCKQFCRLPYKMVCDGIEKEGYFLSTKDFCMLPYLKQLVENGVTSLKIEGRARRPAYVAGAVKVYRHAIDNQFEYKPDSVELLKKLFNRGDYIGGYFGNDKIIYNKTQNHIGVKIGRVVSINKGKRFNEVTIDVKHNLSKGDSLKFFINESEMCSVSVQDVRQVAQNKFVFTTTTNVPSNSVVHLIVDSNLENMLLNEKRYIYVQGEFFGKIGKRATLVLKAEDVIVEAISDAFLEEAKDKPLNEQECISQISKMGDQFRLDVLKTKIENVFMAKSQLNELRRRAVELLKDKILEKNEEKLNVEEVEVKTKFSNKKFTNNKKIIYFSSLKKLEKYKPNGDYLVFNPDFYNEKEIDDFCKNCDKKIYLNLPVISDENEIKLIKNLLDENQNLGIVANNYYALKLTSADNIIIGSEMNVANSYAVQFYVKNGYDKIILTKENFDIDNIESFGAELFVESNVRKTLMHFRHCPFKENVGGDCHNCKYSQNVKFKLRNQEFLLRRKRINSCQFQLIEAKSSCIANKKFGEVVEIC